MVLDPEMVRDAIEYAIVQKFSWPWPLSVLLAGIKGPGDPLY